jgi:hypothetical protein
MRGRVAPFLNDALPQTSRELLATMSREYRHKSEWLHPVVSLRYHC